MPLPSGTRLGPYDIASLIGAGGMGEVYKARDPKLDRLVAIKVLPEGFGQDADRLKRFQQEARVLAALSHPNVVQVFEAGEHEGAPYLVMELLEGETLRERLHGKALPPKRAAELAREVAQGLAAAHGKGILHRDLKPENIFITRDGRVKVLDFGLAKLQGPAIGSEIQTRTNFSEPGRVVGTVGYMSPEQVQGLPLDARSDLFSLGVVLWEMLAGQAPFHRNSALETQHAILKDDPPDLDGALKVPPILQKIVDTCLAKDPASRFHSAHDLAFGLESLSAMSGSGDPAAEAVLLPRRRKHVPILIAVAVVVVGAVAGITVWKPWRPAALPYDPRCVAILPFENRTGDPSLDPLGQRIVELLRQDLQPVDDLKVAADQPLATGPGSPAKRLAEATRAHFVASGSYYLKGSDLEFQGRLEDPWSGKVIYQLGPWKAPKADPDAAIVELRQRLGGAVAWSFERTFRYPPGVVRSPHLDALLVYQQGMNEFGAAPIQKVIAQWEAATALDPDFIPLRTELFDAWFETGRRDKAAEQVTAMEARPGGLTPVERLLTRARRASLEGWRADQVQAFEDLHQLMPGTHLMKIMLGAAYLNVRRPGSAKRIFRQIPIDWTSPDAGVVAQPISWLCLALHTQGNYQDELHEARRGLAGYPNYHWFRGIEARALVGLGRLDEAQGVLDSLRALPRGRGGSDPQNVLHSTMLELRSHCYTDAARKVAVDRLKAIQVLPPDAQTARRENLAQVYLCLDRPGEALPLLQALAEEADPLSVTALERRAAVGATLARLGRTGAARTVEAELAATPLRYLGGVHTFWRACIAANLGEKDRAVNLMRQSFAEGRHMDGRHLDHKNPLLDPLRGYPPYEALMKPKD